MNNIVRQETIEHKAQSNYFALCFLMPEQDFLKAIKENTSIDGKRVDINKVAKRFDVDYRIAEERAVGLGLISRW
jgi:Zn-dependent peptidase ImmA (M78 family)